MNKYMSAADQQRLARSLFPCVGFPWSVFPDLLERSIKNLSYSHSSSPDALPGYLFAIMSAAVGRKFRVQAKDSWVTNLIFWFADIRVSGSGKTPAMSTLSEIIEKLQEEEDDRVDEENTQWGRLGKTARKGLTPPAPPRGYYSTDLTIPGLYKELEGHPTGGIVVLQSELSALVNSYKGGTDRESYLRLFDGKSIRTVRANGTRRIPQPCVQICGGIQPEIFARQFSGKSGLYLEDGTLFRFLLTYEPVTRYYKTDENWEAEDRAVWENTVRNAYDWADSDDTVIALLSSDARKRFLTWVNGIEDHIPDLPGGFKGFVSKASGYALRLAGALHLLDRFSEGLEPLAELTVEDIDRGILVAEYYLGQALNAYFCLSLSSESECSNDESEMGEALAHVLRDLKDQADKGLLAVGYIQEEYKRFVGPGKEITAKKLGMLLRACGLPVSSKLHDANGKKRVHCLIWSDDVDTYISRSLPHDRESLKPSAFDVADAEDVFSSGKPMIISVGDLEEGAEAQRLALKTPVEPVMRDVVTLEMFEMRMRSSIDMGAHLANYADQFLEIAS